MAAVGGQFPGGGEGPLEPSSTDDGVTMLRAIAENLSQLVEVTVDVGNVTGPVGAVDSNLAAFNGTTGRVIKDSAISMASVAASVALTEGLFPAPLVEDAIVAGAATGSDLKNYAGTEQAPSNDLNNVAQTCVVGADSSASNEPSGGGGNFMVLSMRRAAGFMTQFAQDRDQNFAWIRQANSSIWGAWRRLLSASDAASDADVRSAAAATTTDAQLLTAPLLESAAAGVALTDAATVAVNWDSAINFTLTVTANRIIGNPTNGQPGTYRTILVQGNDATDRTITFDTQYLGEVPVITDCDSGRWYKLYIDCITASHFAVSSKRVLG